MNYPPHPDAAYHPPPSNGLAVAGFVTSLVGFFATGGVLCPIGLILSAVALGKPGGRGLAIAGLIIGLFGSGIWILIFLAFGAAILAGIGVGAVLLGPEKIELGTEMIAITIEACQFEERQGRLPESLAELGIKGARLTDPWDTQYHYELSSKEPGFDVVSAGEDQVFGNEDDIRLSSFDQWIDFNDIDIDAWGDEQGGRVDIQIGDRKLHIQGSDQGGSIRMESGDSRLELDNEEK